MHPKIVEGTKMGDKSGGSGSKRQNRNSSPDGARPPKMPSLPPYTGDLATRLGAAFTMDKDTDVVFNFENGAEVKAHRLILATGSPVFDAMFYGGLAEKNQNIPVPDVKADIFRALVHYLYTDEVDPDEDSAIPLLYAAKKYQVAGVERACEEFLADDIDSDNVFSMLDQAILYSADYLREKCLEVIANGLDSLLRSRKMASLSQKGLCAVLEMDTLAVKETAILSSARRWARASCENQGLEVRPENERRVLGPAFNLIRFPLMSAEEFTPIASCGLLTRDEAFHVYREIGGEQFAVLQKCQLVGIGLFGARGVKAENKVTVGINHYGERSLYGPWRNAIRSGGTDKICDVYFPEKVELTPKTTYELSVTVSGPPTFRGTMGGDRDCRESRITASADGIACYFGVGAYSGDTYYASINDGQIPELLFEPL